MIRGLSKEIENRINAAEIWSLRRVLTIGWEGHTTNEEVSIEADIEKKLMKTIKKQPLQFLGHRMRKDGIEELALAGMIAGKTQEEERGSHFYKGL